MDAAESAFDGASGGVTNSDSGLVDVGGTKYELTQENQWGWITLYVVTIVLAILLNLLFIVGGLCTRRTRTTGYYLLLNLSLRDILVAALCVPFTLDSEIIALTWNYGWQGRIRQSSSSDLSSNLIRSSSNLTGFTAKHWTNKFVKL